MVIMKVSSSREKPMLRMVKALRRLLRKAFLVTKRVKVMSELRENTQYVWRWSVPQGPIRIDDETRLDNRARPSLQDITPARFPIQQVTPSAPQVNVTASEVKKSNREMH